MKELRTCYCCEDDKESDDGDHAYNEKEERNGWICRDCLDNGTAEENGWQ